MRTINIYAAKTHLSRLVEDAAAGEEIIIAKAGKPVARLCALGAPEQRRVLGLLKGKLHPPGDIDAPLQDATNDTSMTIAVPWHNLPLTKLIHENFWVIMSYAFATPALTKWVNDNFLGEWKYLGKALFEMPVERVNLALLELATQFRLLDDHHKFGNYFKNTDKPALGKIIKQDGTEEPLYFRDMTNKILHSASIGWNFSDSDRPIVICQALDSEKKRWLRAEIELYHFGWLCGGLMS